MSKILIVDDDIGIRDLCYEAFSADGHEVMAVPRGDQVLETISKYGKMDLILMDIEIPGEQGLTLLKRMPNQKENRTPVIIFSGSVTAELEKEAYEHGALDVIRKGVGMKELRARVSKVLEAKHRVFNESGKESKQGKVLIVDDEQNIRDILKEFFEMKGYQTLAAKNGEEALLYVEKEKPSMILLDIAMPGMDGVMTLKKIREIDPKVGVVMATGAQDEQLTRETAEFGAYAYVLKPFDLKYLELVVLTRLLMSA